MPVSLSKHHGLGNDFLVYDVKQGDPGAAWGDLARHWCARTTGVGADGLLLLGIDGTRLSMRLFNADGTIAEMSGNGIRCLVQAAHRELGGDVGATYEVDTDAGLRIAQVVAAEGPHTVQVRVDMGPVSDLAEPDGWAALECDPMRPVRHLSLGNPHSVVGVEDVTMVDLVRLGGLVPQVNLEIVEPGPGSNAITMRVHERGVGVTQACGTGACAAAEAALAWGIVPRSTDEVVVHMDGGVARVHIAPDRTATLTGPATWIGSVTVDA
ncbi:MAG: diaminopimelate epimerase [Ilumatobacteraceae bacterium]